MLHFSPSRYARSSTTSHFVQNFSGIIALGLAALLFLASLSVPVRAQEPASSSKVPAGERGDGACIHLFTRIPGAIRSALMNQEAGAGGRAM
jgi:hypothetical protein